MKLAGLLWGLAVLGCSVGFAATNTFTGDLNLGPDGVLIGDANDLWRVGGSFNNQTTNTAYNILDSTFEFTGSGPHNLEQFSVDRGPCSGSISNNFAFGTLRIAGTVTVVDNFPNSPGPDAVYAKHLTGSGTLNVGAGKRFYFGSTNGWSGTVNVSGDGVFRRYVADAEDSDGDGMVNAMECLAGTDPENTGSVLRITDIAREGNNIRVTWTVAGGRSYVLQTNAPPPNGSFTNNFSDFSAVLFVPGSGEGTTNYVDPGGALISPSRFYRVRLLP